MAVTGQDIINKAQELCSDAGGVTYTTEQGLAWLNEGQKTIAAVRPDLATVQGTQRLEVGVVQTLPANYSRLATLLYNTESKAGINGPVEWEDLRAHGDIFQEEMTEADVSDYSYDKATPNRFMVYPPNDGTGNVTGDYVAVPTDLRTIEDGIYFSDIYEPMLVQWVIHRFWGRDSEETPNNQRSSQAFQNMMSMLGVKTVKDMQISAGTRKELAEGFKS